MWNSLLLEDIVINQNLKDRLINGDEDVEKELEKKIDFENVNIKLEKFRNTSKEFLKKALSK